MHGIDTSFLVAVEVSEHPQHPAAYKRLKKLLAAGENLALAPQVLAEFIHVITDQKRFASPLDMEAAIARADFWWSAKEVVQVLPNDKSTMLFLKWMGVHRLGRKRVLDTMLGSTYQASGVSSILTLDADDFKIFGCFDLPKI
jgi:predicted nucleic acid-binding protein